MTDRSADPGCTVRPCRSYDDVAAVEAMSPTGPSQFHRQRFEHGEGSVFLLAWVGGAAVGHVLVVRSSFHPEATEQLGVMPELSGLGVAPPARGRGVATALIEASANLARSWGADRLGLAVEHGNDRATRLYATCGFTRVPDLEVHDDWTWLDEDGIEHHEHNPCSYWTLSLQG